MAKRAASTGAASHAKKAKVDPVTAKIEQVVKALHDAELSESMFKMVSDVLPHCLGVVREERHRFQEEAVEMIEAELKKYEASLEQNIDTAQKSKEVLAEQVGVQAGSLTQLQGELEAKRQELQQKKLDLAEAARAFQKTKAQTADRLAQREVGLAEAMKAEASKTKVEGLASEIDEVHKSQDANACAKFIKELTKLIEVDDSMKTAIPSALTKAPEARGGFDAMVVQQLNASIAKTIEELTGKIANAEPMKAALEKDIKDVEAAHLANKEKQMHAAKAFAAIQDAATAKEAEVKAKQKEINGLKRTDKKGAEALAEAQSTLDLFRDGPLAAFTSLKERVAEKADEEMAAAPATGVAAELAEAVAAC